MRKTIAILLAACMALAVLGLSGCDRIVESATKKAVEKTTGVSVDEKSGEVKVKTEDGEATIGGEKGQLPEGFPKDFPTPDGAKLELGTRMGSDGNWSYTVTYKTDAPLSETAKFYSDELPGAGWTVKNTMEAPEAVYLEIEKDANNKGTVAVMKDSESGSDGTLIMVTLTSK